MAFTKNYSVPRDALAWLERITFTFKGEVLDNGDKSLMCDLLRYQYALGCDLLLDSEVDHYRSWLAQTTSIDVFHFGSFLGVVDTKIKNYLGDFENGLRIKDYKSFKRSCECSGFWGFIRPIADYISDYCQNPTPAVMRLIVQWINFIRRANLRSIDLVSESITDYLDFEETASQWTYDEELLQEMNAVIRDWFTGFSIQPEEFTPKHGPGSVSGHKGRLPLPAKYALMGADTRLRYLEKYIGNLESWTPYGFRVPLERTSEIVCVPKSMTTNRTISKEPVSLQYFQQGVMDSLMTWCHEHPYLKHRVDFSDQERSAEMAREGSIFGEFATIDLSAASDSVSHYLVKRVFRGTTVLPWLIATRSDRTRLPDGTELSLAKFAPMGSAVCFPVETIVFMAACECAKRRTQAKVKYRVFGDDIIISRQAVDNLLEIMEALHFKVNATKSFWASELLNFREACGGEYFNGLEVTPMRVSRKFKTPKTMNLSSADEIQSYVSFANQAFDYGFLCMRSEILKDLKIKTPKWIYDQIPFSTTGEIGIKTFPHSCTNYHLSSRQSRYLHRKEVSGLLAKSVIKDNACAICHAFDIDDLFCIDCEQIRYFEWHRLRKGSEASDDLIEAEAIAICPTRSKMSASWVPTEKL